MKGYLLDQNLPVRLTFIPALPVTPVASLGPRPTDSEVWQHARSERLVIVSKDADFSDRNRTLRKLGWEVIRVWEHELPRRNEQRLIRRLPAYLPLSR